MGALVTSSSKASDTHGLREDQRQLLVLLEQTAAWQKYDGGNADRITIIDCYAYIGLPMSTRLEQVHQRLDQLTVRLLEIQVHLGDERAAPVRPLWHCLGWLMGRFDYNLGLRAKRGPKLGRRVEPDEG
jgi:hypothetical protein